MEVAAAVPVKFKRRSVSAVRHWPKGCGPLAVAVGPVPTEPPPAESDTIKLPKSEEVPSPRVTNGLPPAESGGTAASSDQVEALVRSSVPKQEAVELAGSAEAVKPEKIVDLETVEPSKGISDQPDPLDPLKTDEAAGKGFCSRIYPPPKRRKISAIRDFPVGCGRNAPPIVREESSAAASAAAAAASLGREKEHVFNLQSATEVEAPAETTVIESNPILEDLQETSGGTRSKSASAPLKRKAPSDGERKEAVVKPPRAAAEVSARVASAEKLRGEVGRNGGKRVQERAPGISAGDPVKHPLKGSLSGKLIVQALMAALNPSCPWRQGRKSGKFTFTPKKK